MPSHHRVCFRRAATVGVNWATAHGRVLLGMESASAIPHVAHDVVAGDLIPATKKTHHASKGGDV